MPRLNGLEACRRMRSFENEKGRKPTLIVALTALAYEEDRRRSWAAGMDSFLTKPIVQREMTEVVRGPRGRERRQGIGVIHLGDWTNLENG